MRNKFRDLLTKYRSIIIYLLFGALTTAVNYIVYYPLYNVAELSAAVSNIASWFAAVLFAYFTNKCFVFKNRNWNREMVLPEFLKFVSLRLVSGAAETVALFLLVDVLLLNGNIWKILISIIVVILNYIFSKCVVFKNTH